jgi:S1-C subfamily serine protease
VNAFDAIALLVVLLAAWFGFRSGFVSQLLALVGFAVGGLIVFALAPLVAGPLEDINPPLRGLIALGGMATVVLVAQAVGSVVGVALRERMGRGLLGNLDNSAGALFGVLRGLFLVWLAGGLIALAPLPWIQAEARQSLVLRAMDTSLPSPIVLAAQLGRVIEAAGLPTDVFVGVPPAPTQPVDSPTQQAAARIAADALDSTLRVETVACGRFFSGTAFAVSADHFVTNAHVVAGASRLWLSFNGSLDRHQAQVVLFDPELDAALIYAPNLAVSALTLTASVPDRGQVAAGIGYPGGGPEQVIPAAVNRLIQAVGHDIYGTQVVSRAVIEISADVRPGDSGGPLVLPDGTVGGVTFSESRADPTIGYALTPTAISAAIDPAIDSQVAVDTQACLPNLP